MLSVKELIDTLWNVNTLEFTMPFDTSRINRYIMECKLKIEDRQAVVHKRINRYIMECKSKFGIFRNINSPRINRYIMECKSARQKRWGQMGEN